MTMTEECDATSPVEVQDELLEAPGQEVDVSLSLGGGHLVHPPNSECMHRRVHIAKLELVRRELSVGRHVPLSQEEHKLLLGELGVHFGKGNHVEGEVPCGVLGQGGGRGGKE